MTKSDIIKELKSMLEFMETDNNVVYDNMPDELKETTPKWAVSAYKCGKVQYRIRTILIKNGMDDAENKLEEMLKR